MSFSILPITENNNEEEETDIEEQENRMEKKAELAAQRASERRSRHAWRTTWRVHFCKYDAFLVKRWARIVGKYVHAFHKYVVVQRWSRIVMGETCRNSYILSMYLYEFHRARIVKKN